jgi:hypothetical protein
LYCYYTYLGLDGEHFDEIDHLGVMKPSGDVVTRGNTLTGGRIVANGGGVNLGVVVEETNLANFGNC